MQFDELRARWERLNLSTSSSADRAPLVLDEQERSITPSGYVPDPDLPVEKCLDFASDVLLRETQETLKEFVARRPKSDDDNLPAGLRGLPAPLLSGRTVAMDANWLIVWFAHDLLDAGGSKLVRSYIRRDPPLEAIRHSRAEVVEFLRRLSCLMCYALTAIARDGSDAIDPRPPITELDLGNALIYLVAEYAHEDVGVTRRLAIEKHLRSLLGSEAGLYLTRDFNRDHTFHMVYVCLLGDFLLGCRLRDRPLSLYLHDGPSSPAPEDQEGVVAGVRRNWFVAALYHDLGYPLALLEGAGKLTEFLDTKRISAMRDAVRQACKAGAAALNEHAEGILPTGCRLSPDTLDHGVSSAVHLFSLLKDVIEDDELVKAFRPAINAIARHNLLDSKFQAGESVDKSAVGANTPPNEPLTLLLVLCDEVQEWGRVRVDPLRYREEVAAKTQFGGGDPFSTSRILQRLVLNVDRDSEGRCVFDGDRIKLDLVYRPLLRREESYLAIWLTRTRNLQRIFIADTAFAGPPIQIDIDSHWLQQGAKGLAPDDVEALANYVRVGHNWDLDEWLREARERKEKIAYTKPEDDKHGCFHIDVNKLAGSELLPVDPDLDALFKWLRSYPARLSLLTGTT